jgi:hypothetical protein
MADIERVIVIDVEDNASQNLTTIDNNLRSIDETTQDLTNTQKKNTQGVLDNGGAMGLLNDLTGGYAMMVKDAVEASELFSKEGKIATAVQAGYATVVGASTGAMKAFRLALAATGIGLIVVALGLLVANFDKVVKYVQMGIDKFKGMGEGAKLLVSVLFPIVGVVRLITAALEEMGIIDDDATKKAKKNAEDRIKALDKQKVSIEDKYNSEIRLAKAAGKDTVELEKQKRAAILQTLLALNDAEKARIRSGEATADEIKKWNERQKEIRKVIEDGKVAELEQEKKAEDKKQEIRDKANEKKRERTEKAEAAELKRQQDIIKLNEGYVKQLQDLDAKTEEEKLALDRKRAEAELNNLKATSEEKIALKKLYDRKEEDLLKTKQASIDLITADYNNKSRELNAKTDKEKFDLELVKQQEEENKKIAELEKLNATEAEKKAVRDYYTALEAQTRTDFQTNEDVKRTEREALLKEQRDAIYQDQLAAEEAFQAAKRNTLETGLELLLMFAGKNKAIALSVLAVQKGLAIADIVVNASKSIAVQTAASIAATKAQIAQMSLVTPFPANIPAAAGIIAANAGLLTKGIAVTKISAGLNIAAIAASGIASAGNIAGGGGSSVGGAGGSGGGAGGGGAAPQAQFNVVGQSSTNQLAGAIAGQQQQPIQAFVVGSDVTTQQALDRQKINNSTFL